MIRISVQVSSGRARFRVAVQAESIERALESVARQYPGKVCEVTFPIDPEAIRDLTDYHWWPRAA